MTFQLTGTALIVGGTSGIGLAMARRLTAAGLSVLISGRDQKRAEEVAASVGQSCRGLALDLAEPASLAEPLQDLGRIDHVVLAAMERDGNHVRHYNSATAARSLLIKLVGAVEVLHVLGERLSPQGSILIFGGAAFQRPTESSISTATMGAGVIGLARSLASQLAPMRCNVIHPGVVGDTELASAWGDEKLKVVAARTPIGRLVTTEEVVEAGIALMSNPGLNAVSLVVDGGWLVS
jgi:NAD(P)-dependent dehydrogenase (short-subunit alcohol dehydrogenase family)